MRTWRREPAHLLSVLLIGLVAVAVTSCSSHVQTTAFATASPASPAFPSHDMAMVPLSEMPDEVQAAPVLVRQAYQFAAANPEILKHIPCYCGCGGLGHTSNYACYVAGVSETGDRTYDSHALNCSICVDITQDAIRMTGQGYGPPEIRAYVDQTYSKYAPSNMP